MGYDGCEKFSSCNLNYLIQFILFYLDENENKYK